VEFVCSFESVEGTPHNNSAVGYRLRADSFSSESSIGGSKETIPAAAAGETGHAIDIGRRQNQRRVFAISVLKCQDDALLTMPSDRNDFHGKNGIAALRYSSTRMAPTTRIKRRMSQPIKA
jgi:hypothetical protein